MDCSPTNTQSSPLTVTWNPLQLKVESWAPWYSNFKKIQPLQQHDINEKVFIGHMDTGYTDHSDVILSQVEKTIGRNYVEAKSRSAETPHHKLPEFPDDSYFNFQNHGTATMSVVIGKQTIPGSAPQVFYVPFRVASTPILIRSNRFSLAEAIADFYWSMRSASPQSAMLTSHSPNVVSMSLGGRGPNSEGTSTKKVSEIIDLYNKSGIIFVAAAGQFADVSEPDPRLALICNISDIAFPASHPAVIAVGAHDRYGQPNNLGFYNLDNGGDSYVDLLAPGVDVQIARTYRTNGSVSPYMQLELSTGSSYAAQFVAAAAALWILKWGKGRLKSEYGLSGITAAFRECLLSSCDTGTRDAAESHRRVMFGRGLLNVDCLLETPLP